MTFAIAAPLRGDAYLVDGGQGGDPVLGQFVGGRGGRHSVGLGPLQDRGEGVEDASDGGGRQVRVVAGGCQLLGDVDQAAGVGHEVGGVEHAGLGQRGGGGRAVRQLVVR